MKGKPRGLNPKLTHLIEYLGRLSVSTARQQYVGHAIQRRCLQLRMFGAIFQCDTQRPLSLIVLPL